MQPNKKPKPENPTQTSTPEIRAYAPHSPYIPLLFRTPPTTPPAQLSPLQTSRNLDPESKSDPTPPTTTPNTLQ
jgi:hypothetical protein